MKTLIILRGIQGSGKSTWIQENNLENYTLSSDNIRLLFRSPVLNKNGEETISQEENKIVWSTLFSILEKRMEKGEFTIIDACNINTKTLNQYLQLAKEYKYRVFCINFNNVSLSEAKARNLQREQYKQVPENVIDTFYSNMLVEKIPKDITVINPDDFITEVYVKPIDLSNYNNVYVIGDIHGCYTALQELLNNKLEDNNYYIFVGDYLDRGIQNKEVLEYLLTIKSNTNVCLLEGNHDSYPYDYANGKETRSKEFNLITSKQIETIDKREIRDLYRRLRQNIVFTYNRKNFICTHGGISGIQKNIIFNSTYDMIHGIGTYDDIYDCYNSFDREFAGKNVFQINGHRNPKHLPIKQGQCNYNLEGEVEFGGDLRAVKINKEGVEEIYIKNKIFKPREEHLIQKKICPNEFLDTTTVNGAITQLRKNPKLIIEKEFDNIHSFNFSKDVFYNKIWNDITTKARGLFINMNDNTVASRSYNKFFNINEMAETQIETLQKTWTFPLTCYVKENGFLGMLGYNSLTDELLFCSKSSTTSDFAGYFKTIFMQKYGNKLDLFKNYIKNNNACFVFEVIDVANDPHIIEYKENDIILLDIINRELEFNKLSYKELQQFGKENGITVKKKAYTIKNWEEFSNWYAEVLKENYLYNRKQIEGFVIEDKKGFMTKIKLTYYSFWKFMRSITSEVMSEDKDGSRKGQSARASLLPNEEAQKYYKFIRELSQSDYKGNTDIITMRNLFKKEK